MGEDLWICPGCGAELRVGVRGCPHCARRTRKRRKVSAREGKSAPRSWEQDPEYDGLDLPDDDFDYDDFVQREFGGRGKPGLPVKWYWWVTAVVILILIVLAGFRLGAWGINVWK